MRRPQFSPAVFLIVFCCAYIVVFARDLPLFRYYPLHGILSWGPGTLAGHGPGMAWYGLCSSAAAIAIIVAFLIPDRATYVLRGFVWLFPLVAMLACVFLLQGFFT